MNALVSPIVAAVLLFGLSTYFGVFVLESFIRNGEARREARRGSASRIRAQSWWLGPAVWILTVWVMALFVGYFAGVAIAPTENPVGFDPSVLPLPRL